MGLGFAFVSWSLYLDLPAGLRAVGMQAGICLYLVSCILVSLY